MRVYTTLVSRGKREIHISPLGLTSHPFRLSEVNKKRLKAVSQVNKCRVVCLAIKPPHCS